MTKQKTLSIDVVDKYNQPIGANSTIDEACNNGLWHRGAYVILCKPDGSFLVQKRSSKLIQNPGLYKVGAGGFVDSGEEPIEAAAREAYEETGIKVDTADLRFLGMFKSRNQWHYKGRYKLSQSFIYCYLAMIDSDATPKAQPDEVESLEFVSKSELQELLSSGNPIWKKRFNRPLGFFRKVIKAALRELEWADH